MRRQTFVTPWGTTAVVEPPPADKRCEFCGKPGPVALHELRQRLKGGEDCDMCPDCLGRMQEEATFQLSRRRRVA